MTEIAARAEAARRIALLGAEKALAFFRDRAALVVEVKANPQDLVSIADREVEALIRAEVAAAFPDDGFLGEETGLTPGAGPFVWVVDPIDGTSPFLHGMPHWCVAVAVMRGDETVVGVIADPNTGDLYEATLGGGMRLNGVAVRLDPARGIGAGSTGVGASMRSDPGLLCRFIEGLMRRGGVYFRHGSGAMMLAYVAVGRLAGYWEPHMHPWDCLAGLLMIREAGGRTAPYPGSAGLAKGGMVLGGGPGAFDDLTALAAAAMAPAA